MVKELNIEKIIKKVRDDANKDTKGHIGAVFEEFQGRVSGIAEQYRDIQKTLKSHTEKLDMLYVDMTAVKSTIRDLPSHIIFLRDTKLDKKHFAELDQRVRRLEKK